MIHHHPSLYKHSSRWNISIKSSRSIAIIFTKSNYLKLRNKCLLSVEQNFYVALFFIVSLKIWKTHRIRLTPPTQSKMLRSVPPPPPALLLWAVFRIKTKRCKRCLFRGIWLICRFRKTHWVRTSQQTLSKIVCAATVLT